MHLEMEPAGARLSRDLCMFFDCGPHFDTSDILHCLAQSTSGEARITLPQRPICRCGEEDTEEQGLPKEALIIGTLPKSH